jgi:hypothetical protein
MRLLNSPDASTRGAGLASNPSEGELVTGGELDTSQRLGTRRRLDEWGWGIGEELDVEENRDDCGTWGTHGPIDPKE